METWFERFDSIHSGCDIAAAKLSKWPLCWEANLNFAGFSVLLFWQVTGSLEGMKQSVHVVGCISVSLDRQTSVKTKMISVFCNWRDYQRAVAVFGLKVGGFNQKVTSSGFFSLSFKSLLKDKLRLHSAAFKENEVQHIFSNLYEPTTSKEMVPFSLACFGASFFFLFLNFTDVTPVKDWNKMTIRPLISKLSMQTCLCIPRWWGLCAHTFIQMAEKHFFVSMKIFFWICRSFIFTDYKFNPFMHKLWLKSEFLCFYSSLGKTKNWTF